MKTKSNVKFSTIILAVILALFICVLSMAGEPKHDHNKDIPNHEFRVLHESTQNLIESREPIHTYRSGARTWNARRIEVMKIRNRLDMQMRHYELAIQYQAPDNTSEDLDYKELSDIYYRMEEFNHQIEQAIIYRAPNMEEII